MWRWSYAINADENDNKVFSTYVEMIPNSRLQSTSRSEYSPRMWRWSSHNFWSAFPSKVFSTYVEMILKPMSFLLQKIRILHVCGDDPFNPRTYVRCDRYSPRMWRWSFLRVKWLISAAVFSTYVEMIPTGTRAERYSQSILHVCGDDPMTLEKRLISNRYSPRMWRWSSRSALSSSLSSVFSTYVEMILLH